jgi:hypothetical protein
MVYVQERSRVVATPKSHARASATPATPHHFFPFPNALIPPHYCKYLPIDNPVLRLCTTLLVAMYGIIRSDVVSSGSTSERRVHAWREFALQFSFCHVEKVAAQQVVDVEGLREVIAARSKVGADAVTGEGRVLVHVEGIEVERA